MPPEIRPFSFERHGAGLALIYARAFGQSGYGSAGVNIANSLSHLTFQLRSQSGKDIISQIKQEFTAGLVWQGADSVVQGGVSLVAHPLRPDTGIITNVVVDVHARQQGIGRALMTGAIDIVQRSGAKHLALLVDHDNVPAIRLYESLGFQLVGEITHFERKANLPLTPQAQLRRATNGDTDELQRLARLAYPVALGCANMRDEKWFSPMIRAWLVLDGVDKKIAVAVSTQPEDQQTQLKLLMDPKTAFDTGVGVLSTVTSKLNGKVALTLSTHALIPLRVAQACGFEPIRTLRHMCLDLA